MKEQPTQNYLYFSYFVLSTYAECDIMIVSNLFGKTNKIF